MNKRDESVIRLLLEGVNTQREIAEKSTLSLGQVNSIIQKMKNEDFIDVDLNLTKKGVDAIRETSPKNSIILAAGMGFRMIPLNTQTNKAFLSVNRVPLIERMIEQLKSVNITEIIIVVGYLKESFEYLIDKYGVQLIVNSRYYETGSLESLIQAKQYIGNSYIIPCDLYLEFNPFSNIEFTSWYMLGSEMDETSKLLARKNSSIKITKKHGNQMIGIAYILENHVPQILENIKQLHDETGLENHWENLINNENVNLLEDRIVNSSEVLEINTYEDLVKLDELSVSLDNEVISVIEKAMNIDRGSIVNIKSQKAGMTNRSFTFEVNKKSYIMRIPGEGTSELINRGEEYEVYKVIKNLNLSDNVIFFDPETGFKITEFIEGSRNCNSSNIEEVSSAMSMLREFHNRKLKVNHYFDIYEKIEYYENLWNGKASMYSDYTITKEKIYRLKDLIDSYDKELVLCHIDSVPDNFLFCQRDGNEEVKLIDWEYSAMQDPHVDIAMFAIYSLYDKYQIDQIIDIYFKNKCSKEDRRKIYCYVAVCGLLWSNWCEFKSQLGVDFGGYSLKQYRYAKEYYSFVMEMED